MRGRKFLWAAKAIDALGRTTPCGYDGGGNLLSRKDAEEHVTPDAYDANGDKLTWTPSEA